MKLLKTHPLFSLLNSYLIDSPQPVNILYLWNFGSLLGVCLVIQIITGTISELFFPIDSIFEANREVIESTATSTFFFSVSKLSINNLMLRLRKYLNSFDFIKGINYGQSLVTLPLVIETYHSSLGGRMIRVLGGISALILVYNKQELITESSLSGSTMIYYIVLVFGFFHLSYMFTVFFLRFTFILYYIFTGKWIHRNSPLKYILTEGTGAILCVALKGFCFLTGSYFAMAAAANSLDNVLGEPYFNELAIVKEPALMLKAFSETVRNNVTIGPHYNNRNSSNLPAAQILTKLKEYDELNQFKSLLVDNTPEFREVFAELKKELGKDIILEIDKEIARIKKN